MSDTVQGAPTETGCYLVWDKYTGMPRGVVLYVGPEDYMWLHSWSIHREHFWSQAYRHEKIKPNVINVNETRGICDNCGATVCMAGADGQEHSFIWWCANNRCMYHEPQYAFDAIAPHWVKT